MFGKLKAIKGDEITIKLDDELNIYRLQKFAAHKQPTIELSIDDGRQISPDQRKKIFAMLRDMAAYTGYDVQDMEQWMKYFYYAKTGAESFSMSDCSMDQANKFLTFILDFCFANDIPFKTKTWDQIPTDYHLAVQCLRYRKCVICGQPHSDIDHFTPVGRRNRALVDHRKLYFECLCRKHHTERHQLGAKSFIEKYHIKPVRLSEDDLISLNIMTRKRMSEIDGEM
ncbi:putative HNHc nuclease [Lentilactobacillus kefiri]|uniref:putative HNHc nuclease n=1 Tax=Lentilactobacillus kefiri TaxID=33962 RepID=UPI000D6474D1|nr:putative HNHc nuclease [Lentilactobacillus kefiri]